MRIAVAAQGPDLESPVDQRFGRCAYFVLTDPATKECQAVPNEATGAMRGAGTRAAQTLGSKDVDVLLVGNIGPNPLVALRAAGTKIYTGISGTVADSVYAFLAGRLVEVSDATVPTHAGLRNGFKRTT
jgi:predicted Fe-Mo cluster-binding NifX family protein